MTNSANVDTSMIERLQRRVGRAAFGVVVAGLVTGLVLFLLGQPGVSTTVLAVTVAVLTALPVVNLLAVLADEVRRRDWVFALIALWVLALVFYNIASKA